LTIPLILIGASLGLNLTGAKLDFNALMGLLALAGIIVNNAIVLIERIDEERSTGRALESAVVAAAQARLRPIIMTTLTTIVGLVPLYLLGGELWRGMTVVMMFGLGVGTALTLGLVPLLYLLFFSDRSRSAVAGTTKCEPAQG
jgi:multidrug efflux pump subunit AcrB